MSATMTVTSPPMTIEPLSLPGSDVDFGAKIANIDIENLSGKPYLSHAIVE